MNRLLALSSVQLKRAAAIKDQINTLEKELVSLLGSPTVVNEPVPAGRAKRKLSAAGLALSTLNNYAADFADQKKLQEDVDRLTAFY